MVRGFPSLPCSWQWPHRWVLANGKWKRIRKASSGFGPHNLTQSTMPSRFPHQTADCRDLQSRRQNYRREGTWIAESLCRIQPTEYPQWTGMWGRQRLLLSWVTDLGGYLSRQSHCTESIFMSIERLSNLFMVTQLTRGNKFISKWFAFRNHAINLFRNMLFNYISFLQVHFNPTEHNHLYLTYYIWRKWLDKVQRLRPREDNFFKEIIWPQIFLLSPNLH